MYELVNQCKLLIGISEEDISKDELLTLLLKRAERIILSRCHDPNLVGVPTRYIDLQIDAAVTAYNQQGAEGNTTTSSDGIAQGWAYESMTKFIRSNMPVRSVIA